MEQQRATNGVDRCRSCGSSDVSFDGSWLACGYCHQRSNTAVLAEELKLSEGIENLVGTAVLTGAKGIDTSSLVTVRCDGCGATVTINSEATLRATCHWCRHTLSLHSPVDNGAIPDAILPFYVTREDAAQRMAAYVGDQGKFASPDFMRDFEHASIHAVYLPYLVVDGKVTVRLEGRAWDTNPGSRALGSARITFGSGTPEHLTEEFAVMREADLLVDDLAIEARSTRTKLYAAVSTTNIINAIQPFDVEHAMRFNANYITEGIAFEKRDLEVSDAMGDTAGLFATIARGYVNQTLKQYWGGVRWESETVAIKGTRWVSVLLPVWLYAFEENTPKGPMMHYIAVNGRTGETEGSVPTDEARARESGRKWGWVAGPAHEAVSKWRRDMIAQGQRKGGARLKAEFETKYTPTRLQEDDRSLGTFMPDGGLEIKDRNDTRPEVRAEQSLYVLGDLPPLTADEPSTTDSVGTPEFGAQFEKHGRPRAGQRMSAGPPGSRPPIQLIPGWRDS